MKLSLAIIVMAVLATPVYNGDTSTAALTSRVLTPDGADTVVITKTGGTVAMTSGPTNVGSNLRTAFWPVGLPDLADTRVCATWATRSALSVQEGTAHHITGPAGATRAVTVTKNVIYDVHWVFNVHTWVGPVFTQIAQFDMVGVMFRPDGSYQPLPWRVCTQMVGATLTFKIWFPAVMAEPEWGNPIYARSTTVPAAWLTPGQSGWYIGHLPAAAGAASYTGLRIWRLS